MFWVLWLKVMSRGVVKILKKNFFFQVSFSELRKSWELSFGYVSDVYFGFWFFALLLWYQYHRWLLSVVFQENPENRCENSDYRAENRGLSYLNPLVFDDFTLPNRHVSFKGMKQNIQRQFSGVKPMESMYFGSTWSWSLWSWQSHETSL